MEIVWFLLIGLAAGFVAGKLMVGRGFGLIGNTLVGVVGAVLGGWLFGVLGLGPDNLVGALIAAIVGACILLAVVIFAIKKKAGV